MTSPVNPLPLPVVRARKGGVWIPSLRARVTTHLDEASPEDDLTLIRAWARRAEETWNRDKPPESGLGGSVRLRGLFPYQEWGAYRLAHSRCVLLADEPGLGKTAQVAAALSLTTPPIQKSILVLCPASVKFFWARELRRWAGIEATVVSGMDGPPIKGPGVWVMNYRLAPARIPSGAFFQAVILDEAHYIKTLDARRSAAVHSLKSVVRWALTGTPILNRPAELYSVLFWIDPLGWPRKWDFYKTFCGMFYGPRGLDISGATNLGLLRTRLQRTVLIRRTKTQVLPQLPPKRYQLLERAGNPETSRWSESVLEAAFGQNEDLGQMSPEDFFSRLGRLRFLAAGPMAEHVATARRLLGVSKVAWAIEEIRDHLRTGEPLVVWAWHREVLQALKKAFPRAEAITGSTPSGARQRAVERFQRGRANLFLGQIQAAGQGITLTRASTALFVEVDWVPANISQAEDRIHRIGQQNPCLYKFLVWAGSLDALVLQKVREKQEVLDELWG